MGNPQWSSKTSGYETAIWAAKISFCFLGVLAFGAGARSAVPAVAGAVSSSLPGFWASLRSWFAPPYLFVTVHLIIFVIWKLSDQKHHHRNREQWAAEEHMADSGNPAKVKSLESSDATPLLRKPSPEIWRDEISPSPSVTAVAVSLPDPDSDKSSTSDASCLTTETGERSTASSAPVVNKSAEPETKSSITVEDEEDLVAAAVTAAGIENESMEATWKAILEKSSRAAAQTPAAASRRGVEAPPSSTGHDELNRRINDFIKRNHEQIRFLNGRRQ
ncbi:hypothetical protein Cni_G27005 [Canna indica]|uniref:DUF4408 domain-containing protein n=1 Tax=Canna indica TaxID=4628 RepID=A0AAQ3L760_9LILI|nr:hypothetical protein Cni_G27005 [Canna indica]